MTMVVDNIQVVGNGTHWFEGYPDSSGTSIPNVGIDPNYKPAVCPTCGTCPTCGKHTPPVQKYDPYTRPFPSTLPGYVWPTITIPPPETTVFIN